MNVVPSDELVTSFLENSSLFISTHFCTHSVPLCFLVIIQDHPPYLHI